MRIERKTNPRGVDVVPLIDTVFLLLVIFLVMVLRMRVDEGLSVELPPVESGAGAEAAPTPAKNLLVIAVARGGDIVIDGRIVAAAALADLVRGHGVADGAGADRGKKRPVEIRGDRRAPHGAVMAVLAAVQAAGVRDIRFQVTPVQAAAAIRPTPGR